MASFSFGQLNVSAPQVNITSGFIQLKIGQHSSGTRPRWPRNQKLLRGKPKQASKTKPALRALKSYPGKILLQHHGNETVLQSQILLQPPPGGFLDLWVFQTSSHWFLVQRRMHMLLPLFTFLGLIECSIKMVLVSKISAASGNKYPHGLFNLSGSPRWSRNT